MRSSKARTRLVAVLFTDIVRSTEIAQEVGDRRWRALVAAHHRIVRRALKRHHGRELDTAGDGFFASFSRPADAIRCAFEVSEEVREVGLEIRAGLHLGEAEVMGPKVGGVAVNTGARIMGLGKAGEILVSSTVRDAVAGKGIDFGRPRRASAEGARGRVPRVRRHERGRCGPGAPARPPGGSAAPPTAPPEPARRRPWWLAVAGAALVVAAGFSVASLLGDDEVEPEVTGSTGAARALTPADEDVLGLVPEAVIETCTATEPLPVGAIGSVTCVDGDNTARYDTYANTEALRAAFTARTAGLDLPGIPCRDDPGASGSYTVDGTPRGRVACFVDQSSTLAFTSTILWTDDDLLVLGLVQREDVTDFRRSVPDLSLYEWWRTSAGPGTSGRFRSKDDPAHLPSGTFRSVITEAQVGSSDRGGADERWVGTWTITFDGSTFVESFDDGLLQKPIAAEDAADDQSYEIPSELLWGKGDRMVLRRDYSIPPLGGVTPFCGRYESLRWSFEGDRLVFSAPSPEEECDDFRGAAVSQPWERVEA